MGKKSLAKLVVDPYLLTALGLVSRERGVHYQTVLRLGDKVFGQMMNLMDAGYVMSPTNREISETYLLTPHGRLYLEKVLNALKRGLKK